MKLLFLVAPILVLALAGCGKAFPDQAVIDAGKGPPAGQRAPVYSRFAALDRNRDGVLEPEEANGHWTEIFEIMDAKGDGRLTPAEFMALPSPRMTQRVQLMEMEDPVRYAYFLRLDRDGDGVVTLDEFLDARGQLFDMLDRNHDGLLSPSELGIVMRDLPSDQGGLRLPPPPPQQLPATRVGPTAAPAALPAQAPAVAAPPPKEAAPPPSPPAAPKQLPPTQVQPPSAPPPPEQLPPTRVQPPSAPPPG